MAFTREIAMRAQGDRRAVPGGRSRSALLPMLHLVQSEQGYVSPDGIAFCAETLGLTKAEVSAVATFYTMYKRRPTGDWLVSVCTNTMCDVLGGQGLRDARRSTSRSGTTRPPPDGTITLEHAECLAACDYGPVMTVNYEFFDRVDVGQRAGHCDPATGGQAAAADHGAPGSARSRRCRCSSPATPTIAPTRSPTASPASRPCAGNRWPRSTASRCRPRPRHAVGRQPGTAATDEVVPRRTAGQRPKPAGDAPLPQQEAQGGQ